MPTLVGMNSQTQTPFPAPGANSPQQPNAYPRRVLQQQKRLQNPPPSPLRHAQPLLALACNPAQRWQPS